MSVKFDLMEKTFAFLDAQKEAEKRGEREFTCPLCGGRAYWDRAKANHHLIITCMDCGMNARE